MALKRAWPHSWKARYSSSSIRVVPVPSLLASKAYLALDDGVYHSITFGDGWYHGKSFEELRLEDYELGRDAGRWWPGGMLQVNKAKPTALDLATALESLHFP